MKVTATKAYGIYLMLLAVSLVIKKYFPTFSYFEYLDEAGTLYFVLYLIVIKSGTNKMTKRIIIPLALMTIVGLVSNYKSKLISDYFAIAIDALAQWKIFVHFLAFYIIGNKDSRLRLLKTMLFPAECLIVSGAFFGIISQFIDLGMSSSGEIRYGIRSFSYIFGNEGRYGLIVVVAFFVILFNDTSKSQVRFYSMLALINLILTTKGVCYLLLAVYIVLWCLFSSFEKKKKINFRVVIPIGIAGFVVSTYQIKQYFMDFNSPRVLLIVNAVRTANTYFPLGSGFATYASDQAYKHYSQLYYDYGFANLYAMNAENGFALNDSYLSSILGQTGYFGAVLYFISMFIVFIIINRTKCDKEQKALILASIVNMVVCILATGITKSSIGVMMFGMMGYVVGISHYKYNESRTGGYLV